MAKVLNLEMRGPRKNERDDDEDNIVPWGKIEVFAQSSVSS